LPDLTLLSILPRRKTYLTEGYFRSLAAAILSRGTASLQSVRRIWVVKDIGRDEEKERMTSTFFFGTIRPTLDEKAHPELHVMACD